MTRPPVCTVPGCCIDDDVQAAGDDLRDQWEPKPEDLA